MRVERGRRYELRHNTNATALICAAGLLFPACCRLSGSCTLCGIYPTSRPSQLFLCRAVPYQIKTKRAMYHNGGSTEMIMARRLSGISLYFKIPTAIPALICKVFYDGILLDWKQSLSAFWADHPPVYNHISLYLHYSIYPSKLQVASLLVLIAACCMLPHSCINHSLQSAQLLNSYSLL